MVRPETKFFDRVLPMRVQSLLILQEDREAFVTAKMFYYSCSMGRTFDAVASVEHSLDILYPENLAMGRKFRGQQLGMGINADRRRASLVLTSIEIDQKPFTRPLEVWKKKAAKGGFGDKVCYANILLLAGRPTDAEEVYRDLYRSAVETDQRREAAEGVATCLRAEDENVFRANAWLASFLETRSKTVSRLE
jgi:hypothetical protein